MSLASSSAPEWLKALHSSPHIVSVIRTLSQRERTRTSARNASRHRSNPSKAHRISHILPFISNKSDYDDHYSVAVGSSPENERYNRYFDITPYDRTRVVISNRGVERGNEASSPGGRYLNANWVRERAGGKWWIATQAPLPHTAHAFLSVILQPLFHLNAAGSDPSPASSSKTSRIRTVVQLTQNIESGMRKAHIYFPPVEGQSWILEPDKGCPDPSLKVTLLQSKSVEDAQCVQSTVSIEQLGSSQSKPVVFQHLLYGSWPDHGIPSENDRASLLRFAQLVDKVNRDLSAQPQSAELDPDPAIMVNCSAGVGRTGAFIALSSLLRAYGFLSPAATPPEKAPLTPSPLGPLPEEFREDLVAQEVDYLREQRPGMLQKEDQIVFVYDMLMAAFVGTDSARSG